MSHHKQKYLAYRPTLTCNLHSPTLFKHQNNKRVVQQKCLAYRPALTWDVHSPTLFKALLGLLTSQRPHIKQGLFASLRTTSSVILKLVGAGFGPLKQMYPHSVQADLISMKSEPIHFVCFDGAQTNTSPLHRLLYCYAVQNKIANLALQ